MGTGGGGGGGYKERWKIRRKKIERIISSTPHPIYIYYNNAGTLIKWN